MTPQNGTPKVSSHLGNGSLSNHGSPNVFDNKVDMGDDLVEKGSYLSFSPDKSLLENPQEGNNNNNRLDCILLLFLLLISF